MNLNHDLSSRPILTSIYYLLTDDRPIGYFHLNKSDIIHYFHIGSPITYFTISPDGKLEEFTLGHDLSQNHLLQLTVKGGWWKSSFLKKGDFGLISEAVAPGFDYADEVLATQEMLASRFPDIWDKIAMFVKT